MTSPTPFPTRSSAIRTLLLASTALAMAGTALAQQPPADGQPEETPDVVVVVGSQIVGAKPTEALPVTVVGEEELDAIAAMSGDDLFRSIPQLGDVAFNTTRTIGSLNDARGDTASINLRALGTGNTLVLLNGRRMVNHPGTQAENLVPVVTVNTNSIPTMGVRRVEVLLDGASAIYGADAVAGVVNTVLKDNLEGFTLDLTYGSEDDADADEFTASAEFGLSSPDGRTNLSVLASYFTRDPIFARDRDFTSNSDLRSRLPADWASDAAAASFNGTSITSAWGIFDRVSAGNIVVSGTPVTNAAGQFHIQPNALPGCLAALPGSLCIDDTSTRDQALRYDVNRNATVTNGVDRYNAFVFLNHEFDGGLELFAEGGVYLADSVGFRESAPMLGAVPIVVPSTNYYNPFGVVGSPNRLAGYVGPALDLYLGAAPGSGTSAYRPIDAGPRKTEVENLSSRVLAGLRGDWDGWNWESALLYSMAASEDKENRISNTLFQQSLARSTPDAYNPFNGGCINDLSGGDCTPSQIAAIQSFTVPVYRRNNTSIASWDLKLSRPDLFTIWAGDVGAAFGLEARRETFKDDRDPRQDGTTMFTDIISGLTTIDLQGNNQTLDTEGERDVQSAYAEFQIPLVSPEMNIPLAQSIDMQLAVRHENFDTFGGVTKPKVALAWRPFDMLLVRSAWSEGFRAPNLQQQYETGLLRSNNRTDYVRCEAAVRQAINNSLPPPTFTTTCPTASPAAPVISNRQGSAALEPEESTNTTFGFVFEPTFIPEEWGAISFTADWWRVEQENVIGIFGDQNHILLDYVLRLNGDFNPAVIRGTPDAADIAAFAGTGLDPVGDIVLVNDNYLNLDTRTVEGVDLGLYYDLDGTPIGDFSFRINAAYLDKFFQDVSPAGQIINAANAAGDIPTALSVAGQGNLVRDYGRPEWRYTSALSWRMNEWGAGWFTSYTGDVFDDQIVHSVTGDQWIIDEYQTHNLYVQYEFGAETASPTRLRVGMRNITDETPPLAATNFGYLGDLHSAQGRFVYANVRKTF
jgi:iron complex outermembrane receptor protein